MRFTKIIATLGPATSSVEQIEKLATAGVNVCRLNFSHGDYAVHGKTIENIKTVNKRGHSLAIMLDTQGPEIRTGDVTKPMVVAKGDRVVFAFKPTRNDKRTTITLDYAKFADDVKHARCILIDNGAIEFRVETIEKNGAVIARALEDGTIGSRRHVNLPGAHVSLPSFTEKDWSDIGFGIKHGVDFFATSFVRTGSDIKKLKSFLQKNGSEGDIIAKIETPEAVNNIDEIIEAADGVMVARGDLGAEVPFEDVPRIQEMIVYKCRAQCKPVIVATHMLESMILCPMPTRAEVTDIAFAAKLQTDATMLSGETTTGMYPFKAVDAMDRVLRASERIDSSYELTSHTIENASKTIERAKKEQALAACLLASEMKAEAILAISRHGWTAKAVSNCRPLMPVYAFTESGVTQRKLMLAYGVIPHTIPFVPDNEKTLDSAFRVLRSMKTCKKGAKVVVISDINKGRKQIMTVQIRTI